MPLAKPYTKVKNSVVRVIALDGNTKVSDGTGSIIDDGTKVLTCAHCVLEGKQVAIIKPDYSIILGKAVFCDPRTDIALLEFGQQVGPAVEFADSEKRQVGNGVFVVGYPMEVSEQTLMAGHIASITRDYLRIDSSVNHGNSGGPLFDLEGKQIGVVNAKHGALSKFLRKAKEGNLAGTISINGIDPGQTIQVLIEEMQKNMNLGLGYAIPTGRIKSSHAILNKCIP